MLTKLLKYDLKYMIKNMAPFYVLALIFAVISRIILSVEQSTIITIFANISVGCMFSMAASILINVVMRSWVRFRDSVYKDEAYLTHTLPVTKNDIYNSKLIQTLIFFLISFIVVIVSILITFYTEERWLLVKETFKSISQFTNINPVILLISLIVIIFLEIFNAIQCGFFGLILGYGKNNAQILHSVVFGFVAYMVTQTMVGIPGSIVTIFTEEAKVLLLVAIALYALIIIITSIVCKKLLNRGVNIE